MKPLLTMRADPRRRLNLRDQENENRPAEAPIRQVGNYLRQVPLLTALLITLIPFLVFMYSKKPKNDMDQPGKEASSEVQEMASTDSGETEADGTGGEEAAAGESHAGFETIPETEPADSEETEPVVYTIPDGVNNPVAPATDYGNTNTAYQAPAGTVFETATSGMFAPDGTFYYLQSVPDDSYFSDALFIGDSRTDGFRDYSSLKDVASFWAKESLSVYNVLDKSLPLYTHGTWEDSQTLQQVLETHPYGKIYVSMGINEIGMPTTVKYVEKYKPEYMATLLLPAGITSEASIRYKDEAELLEAAADPDRVYVEEIVPQKMKYNLQSIMEFSFIGEIKTMFRTVFAVLGKEYE